MATFTQDDLVRIMSQVAGESAEITSVADIADVSFGHLGYDSLALLETAARIEKEFSVILADDTFLAADTPRRLVELVTAAQGAAA
ncbi:acyl carrier protein [Nonomuraea typhae]|uniref:Acyl carrier protein n=1 Tax=Nonomuraea typhae TaxID=2603600 RepID=A0ABW7YPR4_9ACTN|nr:acyl carrier protein [Nonomuraea typhae]